MATATTTKTKTKATKKTKAKKATKKRATPKKNLVIVESPAKAKTIEKYLGRNYKVVASVGHIRDLKKSSMSIDFENNYEPQYINIRGKGPLIKELKKEAKKAKKVFLASDPDREGEAISWHLSHILGLDPEDKNRVVFNEITKDAVKNAFAEPRAIDMDLVDAQQARRVLDRIVGYSISPLLWKKVKKGLSAGRVQSVALKLIIDRENEIKAFKPEEYWTIDGAFKKGAKKFQASFYGLDGKKLKLNNNDDVKDVLSRIISDDFNVDKVERKERRRNAPLPYTTSSLQQDAANKINFRTRKTMMVAQQLYEGINLGSGAQGLITYMRTDSVNLSDLALNTSKQTILSLMGERYVKVRKFATKTKGAQEAHEAIRPTYMENETVNGTGQEQKLYELIWKRTIASQMADAELEKTTATIVISNSSEKFIATGEVITFDGFLRVYKESYDDDNEQEDEGRLLPPLSKGEKLIRKEILATQRFTQCPPRYTEASLVRKLEELGIGRPSTYAPTISTVQQRGYVEKGNSEGVKRPYDILKLKGGKITETTKTEMTGNEKAKLLPTDTGIVVNDFLMEYFPEIMDFNFTANVEKEFDEVAEGEKEWTGMMDSFYKGFHPLVDKTIHSKTEHKVGERVLGTDPVSGKPVSVKIGRFGPVIQIGTADDEEKPRFAQLAKGLSMETITLEEALDAFKLPRTLGDYDGHTVTVGVGRFGPYVRYDKLFVSIPKGTDPMEISLDEAVELIKNKIEAQEKKFIKVFDADPDMQVLNGRYGPYISYQKKNYKIPENVEPADLSLEACFKVIELQKSKAETRKTKAASRNRGTVNMEEESEKPEESAKSKAASKVKGTAKAKK